jgi:hypothetical protein
MTKQRISTIAACLAVAAIGGCGMESQPVHDQGEDPARELRAATAPIHALQKAKRARALAGPNGSADTSVILDVRSAEQKKFIETRLRHVGKTRETSPNLFARLDQRASKNIALTDTLPADCSNPLSVTQDPMNPNRYEARIITSCFDGADYSYVDLFWWNTATGETLAYDYNEDFNNPRDLTLSIEALSSDIGTTIQVDSMAINSRGIDDYYAYDDVLQERPDTLAATDKIFHPTDANKDGTVVTCLDRTGADCDYYYPGVTAIQLPVSMSFRFPGVVSSVMNAIAQVHMTNSGGVCETANLSASTTKAGAVVTLNTMGPVLFDGASMFGNHCVANQANVRFWVRVIATNTRGATYSMYWANDRPADPLNFGMQFRWSCLAEGSKIVMADGTEKLIEAVEIGERVQSGGPGQSLSVIDVTRGTESAPIVELEAANGSSLLVTQGHPFFDASGKSLRADELQVGSVIKSSTGTTKITKLNRKPFAGKVYNLKLGTEHQIEGLDVGSINMFANGLSVGDSRSQWALEVAREHEMASGPVLPEWKTDSLVRHMPTPGGQRVVR